MCNSGAQVETILDSDDLLRRVPAVWIREDETVSEEAYRPRPIDEEGVSVDLKRLVTKSFNRWKRGAKFEVITITASEPRLHDYDVIHDPYPELEPRNQAHSLITGNMETLAMDEEVLMYLASRATILNSFAE